MTVLRFQSIADVVAQRHNLSCDFRKLFSIAEHYASCRGTPELLSKYGSPIDNRQHLISIKNQITSDVAWFNKERVKKPQQFVQTSNQVSDMGVSKTSCDFCSWDALTAEDDFGRIEGEFCVTASNLFKYVGPYQAVCIFKHHDPLCFSLEMLSDMFSVSNAWFDKCYLDYQNRNEKGVKGRLYPLMVWNCGGRSGASQVHGHSQLLASDRQFPLQEMLQRHIFNEYDGNYYHDLFQAHTEIGLSRGDVRRAGMFASLCPLKDREICIFGNDLTDAEFVKIVHCSLRAMIDILDTSSFNVGVYPRYEGGRMDQGVVCRIVSRGKQSSKSLASDYGGMEVFTGASIIHTDPYDYMKAYDIQYQSYAG
ncbi:hypothetical protein M9434_005764 [Picochlorum sp. BPE23]|nr:hypothetical protein M9434_005764 [Picochlorum sp. BPE23]